MSHAQQTLARGAGYLQYAKYAKYAKHGEHVSQSDRLGDTITNGDSKTGRQNKFNRACRDAVAAKSTTAVILWHR
jgi:hypothetical protein